MVDKVEVDRMREGERRYFWKETFSKKSYKIVGISRK